MLTPFLLAGMLATLANHSSAGTICSIWCTPESLVLGKYPGTLTFPTRIYILGPMKIAGTNVLMPKVSRRAFIPL